MLESFPSSFSSSSSSDSLEELEPELVRCCFRCFLSFPPFFFFLLSFFLSLIFFLPFLLLLFLAFSESLSPFSGVSSGDDPSLASPSTSPCCWVGVPFALDSLSELCAVEGTTTKGPKDGLLPKSKDSKGLGRLPGVAKSGILLSRSVLLPRRWSLSNL